jgi:hypothetical protein
MIRRIALTAAVVAVLTAPVFAEGFVLPESAKDMGCPFVHPSRRNVIVEEPTVEPEPVAPVPDEIRDIRVSGIIGEGKDLVAVVSGKKVRAGDTLKLKAFTFRVEKVTKSEVVLEVTGAKERYRAQVGRTYTRKFAD